MTGPSKTFTALRVVEYGRDVVLQAALRDYTHAATGHLVALLVVPECGPTRFYDRVSRVLGDRAELGAEVHCERYLGPPLDELTGLAHDVALVETDLLRHVAAGLATFSWTTVQEGLRWRPGWRVHDLGYADRVAEVGAERLLTDLRDQQAAVRDLGPQIRTVVMVKLGGLASVGGEAQRELLLGEESPTLVATRAGVAADAVVKAAPAPVVLAWNPACAYAVDELLIELGYRVGRPATWLTVGELDPVEETVSELRRAGAGVD
jgi:hypothetical protein